MAVFGTGPVAPQQDILLGLCVDGLRACQQCAPEELARISSALRALRMTARLQRLVTQVSLFCFECLFYYYVEYPSTVEESLHVSIVKDSPIYTDSYEFPTVRSAYKQ